MSQVQMKYRRLGSTGLLVSELSLGTNTFGGRGHPMWERLGGLSQDDANAVVARAFESGINFFDTADIYGAGESEVAVGEAIRHLGCSRDEIVLATKLSGQVGQHPNGAGASRAHVLSAVDASLKRLRLDHVDVLMIHFFDPATPIEESLRALDDVVRAGKARYIGCSNFAGWQLATAQETARRLGLERFAIIESHWSAVTREIERELVPAARAHGVGMLIWGALLGGLLTGKFADGASGRMSGGPPPTVDAANLERVLSVLKEIASKRGVPASQVALAWLLTHREVTSVLFGARTPEQVDQNVGAVDLALAEDEIAAVAAAAPPSQDHFMQVMRPMLALRGPYADRM